MIRSIRSMALAVIDVERQIHCTQRNHYLWQYRKLQIQCTLERGHEGAFGKGAANCSLQHYFAVGSCQVSPFCRVHNLVVRRARPLVGLTVQGSLQLTHRKAITALSRKVMLHDKLVYILGANAHANVGGK